MGDRSGGVGGGDRGDRIHYPVLTTTNYTSWSIRVQAIMEDQGVWEIMEPSGETSSQDATAVAAAKAKDRKAKACLLQCLPDASRGEEDREGGLGLAEGEIRWRGAGEGGAVAEPEERVRCAEDEGG